MHAPERRGAHIGARTPGRMANWDLVQIFLEVARIGSFRTAADHLGMPADFLSKRISALESAYKATLMTRHVDGIRLTPALSGEVRLAVTEGLGTFWLAPGLVEFQRAYPGLLVNLFAGFKKVSRSKISRIFSDRASRAK
jgi:DNA-binding transcriptional LysR family regulator